MGQLFRVLCMLVLAPCLVDAQTLTTETLQRLRQGGLIIVCRHGKTDWSQKDQEGPIVGYCEKQRNLSSEGRRQVEEMKREIEAISIPIGAVFSSPYCRVRETASSIFGRTVIRDELAERNANGDLMPADHRAFLRELVTTQPTKHTNTAIFTHQPNVQELTGVQLSEGECLILDPSRFPGVGSESELTRVLSNGWTASEAPK